MRQIRKDKKPDCFGLYYGRHCNICRWKERCKNLAIMEER